MRQLGRREAKEGWWAAGGWGTSWARPRQQAWTKENLNGLSYLWRPCEPAARGLPPWGMDSGSPEEMREKHGWTATRRENGIFWSLEHIHISLEPKGWRDRLALDAMLADH